MGNRKMTQKSTPNTPTPMRNLQKDKLGGVIFGCTDSTMNECLSKQLFGLPGQHFLYVQNIEPGLPLFLFNYSKRMLHGIFEAASPGQMNINPYGWTKNGSVKTSYPAQVQVRVLKICHPLVENQFSPIIKGNYFTLSHFQFELDHVQACKLLSLFSSHVIAPSAYEVNSTGNWNILNTRPKKLKVGGKNRIAAPNSEGVSTPCIKSHGQENVHQFLGDDMQALGNKEMEPIHEGLQNLAVNSEPLESYPARQGHDLLDSNAMLAENAEDSMSLLTDPSIIAQLMQEVQELRAFKQESLRKMEQLEQMLHLLQSKVQESRVHGDTMPAPLPDNEESYLHGTVMELSHEKHLDSDDVIFLAGGYDGKSWLDSLESYCPWKDIVKALCPMSFVRSYASLARLNGDVYVIGGGHGDLWYNTVECYSPLKNDWTSLACLSEMKGSLASVTLHDKIYAMGGGNGKKCFSDMEMFDLDVGRWISARSMLQKRFALAAAELNGAVYAVGGFDGKGYLSSAERFDPREHSWSRLGSMNTKRGCHSMVVLNEKLYVIGGFEGSGMVASVEVYDPRFGTWMIDAPMKYKRGYFSSVVLNNSIYAIGGLDGSNNIIEKVERYEEGRGWQLTKLKAVGKRCFAAATV